MARRKSTSRRAGFTLVELLVVIGIIALLISILLPALNKARAQANGVKCASNLRTVNQFIMIYATEFNNYALPANMAANPSRWEWGDWYGILARRYFKANLDNPTTGAALSGAAALRQISMTGLGKFLTCPSIEMPRYDETIGYNQPATNPQTGTPLQWSYMYNVGMGRWESVWNITDSNTIAQFGLRKRNQVPPNVLVLADINPFLPNNRGANTYRFFTFAREVNPLDGSWGASGGYIGSPHGSKAQPKTNALLFNGSVVTVDPKTWNRTPNKWLIDARDWSQNPRHSTNAKAVDTKTVANFD